MTGEKYVVPLDQPAVNTIAYNLLRDGGASMTPPHSLVTRSEVAITGALEFMTIGVDGKRSIGQQTETHTRFDDSSELVTGEFTYPGVRVAYEYPINADGTPGPMQNVRLEPLGPEVRGRLGPNATERLTEAFTDLRPLPSPVPKEGIQLAISPDNELTGSTFIGEITVQNGRGGYEKARVAVTLDEYREWLKDANPDNQLLTLQYLKAKGVDTTGLGTGETSRFLERAKTAFSTFDLDRPGHPAISWNAATDMTPPPGTVIAEANDPLGTEFGEAIIPEPDLPALLQPLAQHWVPGTTADIDWNALLDGQAEYKDVFGGGQDSATVPDPWGGWDSDSLSSFGQIPSWDTGTNFDDAWAGAWDSPMEYSDADQYVGEYL